MTVEEAVAEWLRRKGYVRDGQVCDVCFRHEEGYSNDSGTDWPCETVIEYRIVKITDQGKRRSVRRNTRIVGDPMDFARDLFAIAEEAEKR